LAGEVGNSAKQICSVSVKLMFFLNDLKVSENNVLEARWCS